MMLSLFFQVAAASSNVRSTRYTYIYKSLFDCKQVADACMYISLCFCFAMRNPYNSLYFLPPPLLILAPSESFLFQITRAQQQSKRQHKLFGRINRRKGENEALNKRVKLLHEHSLSLSSSRYSRDRGIVTLKR